MICAHWFQLKVNCYVELANIFVVCMIKRNLGHNIRNSEKYPAFYKFPFVFKLLFQEKSILNNDLLVEPQEQAEKSLIIYFWTNRENFFKCVEGKLYWSLFLFDLCVSLFFSSFSEYHATVENFSLQPTHS